MYNCTAKQLIDYVTVKYSSNMMKNLVKYQEEKEITEPRASSLQMRQKRRRAKLLVCITRKCSTTSCRTNVSMKPKGKSLWCDPWSVYPPRCDQQAAGERDTNKCAKIEQNNDVVGLLDMFKVMSHSTVGVQNPY
jgi:hypothetical protein